MPAGLCTAGAFLLGSLLALFFVRRAPVEETVLSTLERAAERVAQGDLSSTIQLRVGGRADQTFRSFDRMTRELRETRAKLADAERAAAWQDMAQRVAHEIKNPLSPIKMGLETLRKAHATNSAVFEEIFDESTHAMLEEVQRIEHIVREFSDFARLPRARPGALDLAELVKEVSGLYTPADVELTLSLSEGLSAHADREQISQVLVNLLANAIDAARAASAPRVALSVLRVQGELLLRVDDNGAGVPEKDRARIFEPYVTGKQQGTGLGLAIVRRIVQDHGGSVHVERSPLGGARLEVRLPAPGNA
jgi:nitrogen fixation/metabolism regulation signal transduction histidine kinase